MPGPAAALLLTKPLLSDPEPPNPANYSKLITDLFTHARFMYKHTSLLQILNIYHRIWFSYEDL